MLIKEAEKIFCKSLGTEPTLEESRPVAQTEMTTLPTNKVGSKRNRMGSYTKEEKPSIDFSLGFVLTGECHELKKTFQQFCKKKRRKNHKKPTIKS